MSDEDAVIKVHKETCKGTVIVKDKEIKVDIKTTYTEHESGRVDCTVGVPCLKTKVIGQK